VISLRNPVTGHEVKTDEASADFWSGAGYREIKAKAPAKKAAAKKSTSNKK
jgi:hypothetical protein